MSRTFDPEIASLADAMVERDGVEETISTLARRRTDRDIDTGRANEALAYVKREYEVTNT